MSDNSTPEDAFPPPALAVASQPTLEPYPGNLNSTPKWSSAKSVWGGIVAFVLAFAGALQVAIAAGGDLTQWQLWLNVLLVAVVGGGGTSTAVYQVSNKVKYV